MRRFSASVLPPLLTGLGSFCIVLALLFRFFLPGQTVKFPLNWYEVMTLQGTGASYFSAGQLKVLTGVTMRATVTIKGDVAQSKAAGSSNIAVWKSFTAVEDISNRVPFQYTYQQLAFDRKTGQLINCCGNVIGTKHNPRLSGQGYVWPFSTQQRNYQVFDTTLLKPVTFRYAGTATTGSIATYRFTEQVQNQQIGTQTLPGSLVGMTAASVTLPEFYTADNTYWVDPVTGDPLKINQNETLTLQDSTGATRLLVFQGNLTTTPASVQNAAALDRPNINKIHLLKVIAPIIGILLGIVLLAIGLLLSRSRRGGAHESREDEEPVDSRA